MATSANTTTGLRIYKPTAAHSGRPNKRPKTTAGNLITRFPDRLRRRAAHFFVPVAYDELPSRSRTRVSSLRRRSGRLELLLALVHLVLDLVGRLVLGLRGLHVLH